MVKYGTMLKYKFFKGSKKLYKTVRKTFGPQAEYGLICYDNYFKIIDDGATIASSITLDNNIENAASKIISSGALEMKYIVGDGTTTTILYTYFILKKLIKYISFKQIFKKKLDALLLAKDKFIDYVNNNSQMVKNSNELTDIFKISSNLHDVSEIVKEALKKVGLYGYISIEENNNESDELIIENGYSIDSSFCNKYIFNNQEKTVVNNFKILITNKEIDCSFLNLLDVTNIIIFADKITDEAINKIIVNNLEKEEKIYVIIVDEKKYHVRDELDDLCAITNSKFLSKSFNLDNGKIKNYLGNSQKVIMTNNKTIIYSDIINEEYIKMLKKKGDLISNLYERDFYNQRISKLSNGIANIKIGGKSEVERKNRFLKARDGISAINASRNFGLSFDAYSEYLNFIHSNKDNRVLHYVIKSVKKELLKNNCQSIINDSKEPTLLLTKSLDISCSIAYSLLSTSSFITKKIDDNEFDD